MDIENYSGDSWKVTRREREKWVNESFWQWKGGGGKDWKKGMGKK